MVEWRGILIQWTGTKSCVCFEHFRQRDSNTCGDLYFDVLTRLGEAATFETVAAEIKDIDGTQVSVATPSALYKLKKGTIRLQDQADAAALRERFNLTDEN